MKILFCTNFKDEPSTVLNISNMKYINQIDGHIIDFFRHDYANYDVVLFMGYDPDILAARKANKSIKIGIIDPRPSSGIDIKSADFIIANGIEMKDYYINLVPSIFIYPIFPNLSGKPKLHQKKDKLIIGYHGNKIHLEVMYPRITKALEALGVDYSVELWAMYNIEKLGKWTIGIPDPLKIKTLHIQWAPENYEKYIAQCDIGIVPNLLPIQNQRKLKKLTSSNSRRFNEDDTDYVLRFKATSNAGRIWVFAQYGIPVITDMFPSALQAIKDNEDGFICNSSASWYLALRRLSESAELRNKIGNALYEKFEKEFSPIVLNNNLINFIKELPPRKNWNYHNEFSENGIVEGLHVSRYGSRIYAMIKRHINRWLFI